LFSDDVLKTDIVLKWRRSDGLGVYDFRYSGGDEVFRGVLVSEVEKAYPHAVSLDKATGFKKVDYAAIGASFERVS